MRYFVVGPNGQRYGPADIETLNQWAQQMRVDPYSTIEEEGTGRSFRACDLPGLMFPGMAFGTPPPAQAPPPANYPGYYRQGYAPAPQAGQTECILAWIFGSVSILICPPLFGIPAIILAAVALSKGNTKGAAALAFSICAMIVGMIFGAIVWNLRLGGRF